MFKKFIKEKKGFTRPNFFKKNLGGFTLIELLVVIAVIGLLASIVLVSLGPARKKARDARRQSDIRQINLAMEMCYDDSGCAGAEKYPTWTAGTNLKDETIDTDGDPLYLKIPGDPKNTDDYIYKYLSGTDQNYCILVKLESPATTTWFCASNKGVAKKEYPSGSPSKDDCCGMDIDD